MKEERKLELQEKKIVNNEEETLQAWREKSGQGGRPRGVCGGADASKRSKYKKIEAKRGRGEKRGKKEKEKER